MNDSMVDRLDDNEPVTITEALEIPHPRAVGSPLPRGNGNRISVPPTYAELEERPPMPLGPILAPPPANFSFAASPVRMAAPAPPAPAPEPPPLPAWVASEVAPTVAPLPISAAVPAAAHPAVPAPAAEAAPAVHQQVPVERPAAIQPRSHEQPSTLQRAAGVIRHAIPIVQKLLPLLDGNIATVVSNILSPPPPPPPAPSTALAPSQPPARVDLTPLKEEIAEMQMLHKQLLDQVADQNNSLQRVHDQVADQNNSLKRVEDHLELVREATDRNTLEQQELMEDLKSVSSKVNIVAAIAIGLLAISLLVNMALYLHLQRVLP